MLYVLFTRLEHSKIKKYEKIPFNDAVALSAELEQEMRQQKQQLEGDFTVIDDNDDSQAYYSGTFIFGSYFAPNLYKHIMQKLPSIKRFGQKEKANEQVVFMQKMDSAVDDVFKQDENINPELYESIDRNKLSRLKKWQRWTVYGLGAFFAVAFIGTLTFFLTQIGAINSDYQALKKDLDTSEKANDYYSDALLGNDKKLRKYLATKEKANELDDQERNLYAMYLAEDDNYEELVQFYEGDTKKVANFLSKNMGIDKLKDFDEDYPTQEASFDIAYDNEKYDKALSIEDYDLTKDRSKKKTYAFLKTGKLDKAKDELENNNDEDMQEKVTKYEDLEKQINDLQEDDEDHEDKVDELKEEQEEI